MQGALHLHSARGAGRVGSPSLVGPVGSGAVLCHLVHAAGPDLHLQRDALGICSSSALLSAPSTCRRAALPAVCWCPVRLQAGCKGQGVALVRGRTCDSSVQALVPGWRGIGDVVITLPQHLREHMFIVGSQQCCSSWHTH